MYHEMLEGFKTIPQLIREVNHIRSPCSPEFWMCTPTMGLVFATRYQVALVVLSWFGPCTCLPMFAPPGSEPPTTVFAIAHVGRRNHYVPVRIDIFRSCTLFHICFLVYNNNFVLKDLVG